MGLWVGGWERDGGGARKKREATKNTQKAVSLFGMHMVLFLCVAFFVFFCGGVVEVIDEHSQDDERGQRTEQENGGGSARDGRFACGLPHK